MDFWDVHGIGFIICLAFLPRLTMLLTGIFMSWMCPLFLFGWIFAPRLAVAIMASMVYFDTNPVLCILTWLWALGGESTEKKTCMGCGNGNRFRYDR